MDDWEYCYLHLVRGENGSGSRVLIEFPEDPESAREYNLNDLAKADTWLLDNGWVPIRPPKEVVAFVQAGIVRSLASYYFYRRARRKKQEQVK